MADGGEPKRDPAPTGRGAAAGPSRIAGLALLAALSIALLGFLATDAAKHSLDKSAWRYGDWAINYAGGFVRRGLAGHGLLLLSPLVAPPAALAALKSALYAATFAALAAIAIRIRRPLFVFLLFFAPLGMGFVLVDASFEGRKELALIVFLALFVWADGAGSRARSVAGWAAGPVLAALTLSHEALAVFMTPIWLMLAMRVRSGEAPALQLLSAVALPAAALVASLMATGSQTQIAGICASLGADAPDRCPTAGATSWLAHSPQQALDEVRAELTPQWLARQFARAAAGLAVLAAVIAAWRGKGESWARIHWLMLAGATAFAAPLFAFATDWQRWLRLLYIGHAFLALALVQRGELRLDALPQARRAWAAGLVVVLAAATYNAL